MIVFSRDDGVVSLLPGEQLALNPDMVTQLIWDDEQLALTTGGDVILIDRGTVAAHMIFNYFNLVP